jgi:tetratricopeptide (TPR) repeat protein
MLCSLGMHRSVPLIFVTAALSFSLLIQATAQNTASLLAKADHLEKQGHYSQQLESLQQANRTNPDNPNILTRLSRAYSNAADPLPNNSKKESYAKLALTTAKRAVEKAPNSSKAHTALSIAYGNITDYVDNKTKMSYSKVIKAEAEKAIQLDSNNSEPYFILARWNYEMATLNPIMRGFAEMLYGQLPSASKERAMELFRKAIALSPNEIGYHAEYARALDNSGQKQLSKIEWTKVLQLPAIDAQDRKNQSEAGNILLQGSKR